jgi:uncharacterized protein YutE (UPF0331/DUF86 family)
VRRKARLILEDLDRLREYAAKSLNDYLESPVDELVTERLLERIIGRVIDVNYHLLVESKGLPPKDYHESFSSLAELGLLPRDRAAELARASGMRNRLAHEYEDIDPKLVHAAAGAAVRDVPEYLRAIEAFLERDG